MHDIKCLFGAGGGRRCGMDYIRTNNSCYCVCCLCSSPIVLLSLPPLSLPPSILYPVCVPVLALKLLSKRHSRFSQRPFQRARYAASTSTSQRNTAKRQYTTRVTLHVQTIHSTDDLTLNTSERMAIDKLIALSWQQAGSSVSNHTSCETACLP